MCSCDIFPKKWGKPPKSKTGKMVGPLVKLPGNRGMGSPALYDWIVKNMKKHGIIF